MVSELPKKIGNYLILNKLGSGGMADVYEALDEKLDRRIALKLLPTKYAEDGERVDRFEREILATAKLNHPNIVTVYDAGVDGEYSYYTMALLPGGELKAQIQAGLNHREIIRICKEIAAALSYAHENDFVHRDLKPENILFDAHGNAVVTDLGIAKLVGSSMTATGLSIGTPYYMSPEQARGQSIDGRADIYSLGVILYRMITREHLFDAEESMGICMKHIQDPPPPLPDDAKIFQPILHKLLEKNPDDRYQNAEDLILALKKLEESIEEADKTLISTPIEAAATRKKETKNKQTTTDAPAENKNKASPALWSLGFIILGLAVAGSFLFFSAQDTADTAERIVDGGKADNDASEKTDSDNKPDADKIPADEGKGKEGIALSGHAILQVDSSPENAQLYLGKQLLGTTPFMWENLPAGEQSFTLRKRFYKDLSFKLTLVDKKISKHSASMEQGRGNLSVISEPAGAELWIDGTKQDYKTPTTIEGLAAGEHRIEIRLNDAVAEHKVLVDHEQTQLLRSALKTGELIAHKDQWLSLDKLFELAKTATEQGKTLAPEGENALEIYRVILSHAPKNGLALKAVDQFLQNEKAAIEKHIENKNYPQAQKTNESTKKYFPEYISYTSTSEKIATLQEKQKQISEKEDYELAIKPILKKIKAEHFAEAKIELDALRQAHPNGEHNKALGKALKRGRIKFRQKVEKYSGNLKLVKQANTASWWRVAKTELTREQWGHCVADGACSQTKAETGKALEPVVLVSFRDIDKDFLPWLRQKTQLQFRLPTQEEWEYLYAADGRTYYWGETKSASYANGAERFSWPVDGYSGSAAPVGSFKANKYGLFDLAGNVWEWTSTCAQANTAKENCNRRIIKGGSWFSASKFLSAKELMLVSQNDKAKDRGFRVIVDYQWMN